MQSLSQRVAVRLRRHAVIYDRCNCFFLQRTDVLIASRLETSRRNLFYDIHTRLDQKVGKRLY